ncbi:calcium-dependent phosphotriesterase [Hypomontagnella submonticulosa]|nr:calcium-dependent phosphotriesterase [Hypomontagnella submonticulosa]
MGISLYVTLVVVGVLSALLYTPVKRGVVVLGFLRPIESWQNVHGIENRVIEDTVACEDLHYHEPSGMLYSACGGDLEKAATWFPGAGSLGHPENAGYGSLVLINPKTFKSQKLTLTGFEGPFVTHGISLYSPPSDLNTVYIFAINHLPNPLWTESSTEPKAASHVELFVHTVGSDTAKHLQSISHPLIRTPNDLLALSEREFLVTNDHYYRHGTMRLLEELIQAKWANLVHVRINNATNATAAIILDSIPNNNGLGWGPNEQILISAATGGGLYFARLGGEDNRTLSVTHSVQSDGIVDNPHFFSDPWAGLDGKDYSGYLLPGLGRGVGFVEDYQDPTGKAPLASLVYYLPASAGKAEGSRKQKPKLVFSDNGSALRGATTAVIVAIDPTTNGGKREGWLFVTGVIAPNMLATRIDFATALA